MNRRQVLERLSKLVALSGASLGLGAFFKARSRRPEARYVSLTPRRQETPEDPRYPDLAVVKNGAPEELVHRAVAALGGMARFVSRGDVVLIKPNVAWDRIPEQAANTNPDVVAAVCRLCFEAGAKNVIVTDVSCNDARRCFQRSGIAEAATREGATVLLPERRHFVRTDLHGEFIGIWPVLRPVLEVDKIINLPIAKHHSLTSVTLGMKNWYGIIGGERHTLHQRIHESIVDLADFVRPNLTILDAYRILKRGGPTGGSLRYVEERQILVAGTDPVAVDAWAAWTFWSIAPEKLRFLTLGKVRGLGEFDLQRVRIAQFDLAS